MQKTVTREHQLYSILIGQRTIESYGVFDIFTVKEQYNGLEVSKWTEDNGGRKLIKCQSYQCNIYCLLKDDKDKFRCVPCTIRITKEREEREQEKRYDVAFEKRIKEFTKAARNKYPELNVRKGRGAHDIMFDADYPTEQERMEMLNPIALSFNCKLGTSARRVKEGWGQYRNDRRAVVVIDHNPFIKI